MIIVIMSMDISYIFSLDSYLSIFPEDLDFQIFSKISINVIAHIKSLSVDQVSLSKSALLL